MNINSLYKDVNTSIVYRVIDINILLNRIAIIDIFSNNNCPQWKMLNEFESLIKNNVLQDMPECFPRFIDDSVLTEIEVNHRDKLMECVRFGLENYKSEILERESRNSTFQILAEKFNISLRTVERAFGRYWKRGMTKTALLPHYKLERKDKERAIIFKNGRKRIYSETTGILITDDIKKQMKDVIDNVYLTKKKRTFQKAYENLLSKYYHDHRYLDDYGEPIYDENYVPTLSQFYYYFRKNYPLIVKKKKRKGSAQAEQECRALLNNSYKDAPGPGHVYQLDATVFDVVIVHSGTRQPIGKPLVICLIDVYSRLVVGLYVTLMEECFESLSLAILNVITDKVEFCKRQGIEILPEQWPQSSLPARILTDNGPARNILFDYFIEKYNVDIEHTGPYRGDLKGIVENFWRVLNLEARTELDGGGTWPLTRMVKDPSQYANLDLNQLTKIITLLTIKHNTCKIEKLKQEKDMLYSRVKPIPTEMWNFGYNAQKGYINYVGDVNQLKLALMRHGVATITKFGIQVNEKRNYYCELFKSEKWHLTRLNEKVNFKYDSGCIDVIYLLTRSGSIPCFLAGNSEQYLGLTEYEFNVINQNSAQANYYLTKTKVAKSIDTDSMIAEVQAEAAQKTKLARESNNISSISNSEARKDEMEGNRTGEFLTSNLTEEQERKIRVYKSNVNPIGRDSSEHDICSDDFLLNSINKLHSKEEAK